MGRSCSLEVSFEGFGVVASLSIGEDEPGLSLVQHIVIPGSCNYSGSCH